MSKRMNMKVVEEESKVVVGREELLRVLEEEKDEGRGNGVVERIRGIVRDVLEIEKEISVGRLNRVVNKLEGREVDYSVIRYSVLKMDDVEMVKKGKVNWVRKR